ncbi:MAG: DNRLRE domain-containing protein [Candidatus Daviesbacteria bacterium]|nr:MAG: DNRLRE domain-containing protein [Candidatus Daviesbacteria bacterium]
MKIFKKVFAIFSVLALIWSQILAPSLILAQEVTSSSSAELSVSQEPSPTPSPTLILDENLQAPPATESAVIIDTTPAENEPSATVTPEVWQGNEDGSSTTTANVVLNQIYKAPQNDKVTVTFTKLPEPPGTLTIKQIILSQEDKEDLGAFSDTAYEITSTMQNETFEYDLTLPLPSEAKDKDIEIKVAENVDGLDSGETVEPKEKTAEFVKITGLNHFTVFVLVPPATTGVTNQAIAVVADAYIKQDATTTNFGNTGGDIISVYSRTTNMNRRAVVKFDISSIPTGSTVSNATLKLKITNPPDVSRQHDVYKITADWVEGDGGTNNSPVGEVAWDSLNGTRTPTLTFSGSPTSSVTTGTTDNTVISWNVTADVNAYLAGSTTNYGWIIRDSVEDGTSTDDYSVDYAASTATSANRPQLSITFDQSNVSGYHHATSQAAVTSSAGDNTGYQTNPTSVFAPDNIYAVDTDSGTATNDTCTGTGNDKHIFSNFDLDTQIPDGDVIDGIEVRQDLKVDSLTSSPFSCVEISWDGGANWTSVEHKQTLSTTTETSYTFGSSIDTWGRTWSKNGTANDFSNPNFRVRVINGDTNSGGSGRDFSLDWIGAKITHYTPGTIVIIKNSVPNDEQDFSFTTSGDGLSDFSLDDDTDNTLSNQQTFTNLTPGSYDVVEDGVDGWQLTDLSCDDDNSETDLDNGATINVEAGETVTCTFENTKRARIMVDKVTDPSGNPQSFDFNLTGGISEIVDESFSLTDGSEEFSTGFSLEPGDGYSISEDLPEGWDLTSATCSDDSSVDNISLDAGESVTCTFINTKLGSISGYKFYDWDGDGIWDDTEDPIEEWLINLSGAAEEETTTESGEWGDWGYYFFGNLLPGIYNVCEGTENNWIQTFPTSGFGCDNGTVGYEIPLSAGQESTGNNFGNTQPGSISGQKFEDLDGDGIKDEDEIGIEGWTIFLDTDSDGVLDEDEVSTDTDGDGNYGFANLEPGTYKVREVSQDGWVQKTENPEDITINSGEEKTGIDFGNFKKVIITGLKWEDLNANGVKEDAEPVLGGWNIDVSRVTTSSKLSEDGLSTIPIELVQLQLTSQTATSSGEFTAIVDRPGTYRITEQPQTGFQPTSPGKSYTDSFFDIFVDFSGQVTPGQKTSITKDKNGKLLWFGNAPYQQIGGTGTKFVPTSGNSSLTISLIVVDPAPICPGGACVTVEGQTVGSNVVLQSGTIITKSGGGNFDASQLGASSPTLSSMTGLDSNVVVDGALQWGIPDFGLEFKDSNGDPKPITLNIFVGTSLNGQVLNVVRSAGLTGPWVSEGIEDPKTCTVAAGICTFQATKASFYATTHTATTSSSSTSGGGVSLSAAGAPSCGDTKPGSAPTLLSATPGANSVNLAWSKAVNPVTYYLVNYSTTPGTFQFGNPNVGGSDTTSYIVSGLSGGVTYYFKVRAGNGCAPGSYSNELAATPGGETISGPAAGFAPGILGVSTDSQENIEVDTQTGAVKGETTGETTSPSVASTSINPVQAIFNFLGTILGWIGSWFK